MPDNSSSDSLTTDYVDEDQDMEFKEKVDRMDYPGSVTSETPDDPNRGKDWHNTSFNKSVSDANFLLKSLRHKIEVAEEMNNNYLNDKELEFMMGVLGKDPKIKKSLSAVERVKYNSWLNSNINKSLSALDKWRK